jgi:hypothetical protein
MLAATLLAASLSAETVTFTAHGKTFHKDEKCMSLSRANKDKFLHADRAEAEKHGLKACGICYRTPSTSKKSATNNDWAKGAK